MGNPSSPVERAAKTQPVESTTSNLSPNPQALVNANHAPKKKGKKERSISKIHVGITCKGCGKKDFAGPRHVCLSCPDYDLCDPCWNNSIETPPHSDFHETKMFRRPLRVQDTPKKSQVADTRFPLPNAPPLPLCGLCGSEDPNHSILECRGRPD